MATKAFNDVLREAINDLTEHGYDNVTRIEYWLQRLREAAEQDVGPTVDMDRLLRDTLEAVYRRLVDNGQLLRYHPGVGRFTLDKVRPELRAELDRRIIAATDLIKRNRKEAVEKTLHRFQGWSTSIPKGGTDAINRLRASGELKKPLQRLGYEERRLAIDQGHKLRSAISEIVATDAGAIAVIWHSQWRRNPTRAKDGYQWRKDHKERDGKVYLIRDSWAKTKGFVKPGKNGYFDDITKPGEEVYCLIGESSIQYADSIAKAYKRFYSGELTTLITATGNRLSITPNHPILSEHGWVAGGTLQEGDYIVEIAQEVGRPEGFTTAEINSDSTVPTIAQIFSAASKFGTKNPVRSTSEQFHGDGMPDGNVDIVRPAGLLSYDFVPKAEQLINQLHFSITNSRLIGDHTDGHSPFSLFGITGNRVRSRLVSIFNKLFAPFRSSLGVLNPIGISASSGLTASLNNVTSNHSATDLVFFRKLQNASAAFMGSSKRRSVHGQFVGRWQSITEVQEPFVVPFPKGADVNTKSVSDLRNGFPFGTKLSRIVKVERKFWSGHVYNLQTSDGWYAAQNIICHNCSCQVTYLYNLRQLPEELLTQSGKKILKETRTSFSDARSDSVDDAGGNGVPSGLWSEVKALDKFRFLRGFSNMKIVPDTDEWHAYQDPDTDKIVVQEKVLFKPRDEQLHILLHEAGHRGQEVMKNEYELFKNVHLNRLSYFIDMANHVHLLDYAKTGQVDSVASEVWAESYSRFCLGLWMPDELKVWWDEISRTIIPG